MDGKNRGGVRWQPGGPDEPVTVGSDGLQPSLACGHDDRGAIAGRKTILRASFRTGDRTAFDRRALRQIHEGLAGDGERRREAEDMPRHRGPDGYHVHPTPPSARTKGCKCRRSSVLTRSAPPASARLTLSPFVNRHA